MKNFTFLKPTKTAILCCLFLWTAGINAQDKGFVHIATADNIASNLTYIDHPDLNGNPNARFLFSQRSDDEDTVNNNPTGIWYNGSNWTIYNENMVTMPIGVQFNIYIPDDSNVQVHIANNTNIFEHQTTLSGYEQGQYLFTNHYYNPNGVYNTGNYGTWFNAGNRIIYEESRTFIPEGAAFFVMSGSGETATRFSKVSNASNIAGSTMIIDDPLLNGNPDAVFLYGHYWGYPGGENETYLPYVTDAYYFEGYWRVFSYGPSFPENVWFDFIVPDEILGTEDQSVKMDKIEIYPNPAIDIVNFSSKSEIKDITIYDVSGKVIINSKKSGTNLQIDVSGLPKGIYLANVKTDKGNRSQKLIKK